MSKYDRNQRGSIENSAHERRERGAYYGSPHDVGNYASHYDENSKAGDQRIDVIPGVQPAGKADHRGKGPRSYQRSDKRILEDINDHLYLDSYVDATDIEVRVDNGEVTLTGTIEDRNAKRRAEDIADSIPGVRNVENRIRVKRAHAIGPVRSNAREELM